MTPPDLTVVIPCYQEAPHLKGSVAELRRVLDAAGLSYELVFVDDASTDATPALIRELCAGRTDARAVFHERNRGRGAAFKTGFAQARGRVAGFLDIDLEVHPSHVPALVETLLRGEADVATGLRTYAMSQTGGLVREVLSRGYRLLCRFLLGTLVKDSETGCKFFLRETASAVVLESRDDGWFWDTEVMSRSALAGLRIRELPVLFVRRADKRSTVRIWRDSWRYFRSLLAFRRSAGLSMLDRSPIYWTRRGYDLAVRIAGGRRLEGTYADVARWIPPGASVLDVCCGTARLYRDTLRGRGNGYLGLDANGHFVMSLRKMGIPARRMDLLTDPLPPADAVVLCSSLYHFRERQDEVLAKLLAAARGVLILSEPVRNLSTSWPRPLGRLVNALTNPGTGSYEYRYDLPAFRELAERHGALEILYDLSRKNAIAVFRKPETPRAP